MDERIEKEEKVGYNYSTNDHVTARRNGDAPPNIDRIIEQLQADKFVLEHLATTQKTPQSQAWPSDEKALSRNIQIVREKMIRPGMLLGKNHLLKRSIRRFTKLLEAQREKVSALENQFQHRVQRALFEQLRSKTKSPKPSSSKRSVG